MGTDGAVPVAKQPVALPEGAAGGGGCTRCSGCMRAVCSSSWSAARVVAGVHLRSAKGGGAGDAAGSVATFLDFVHCLNKLVPVLLLGDFDGMVNPPRDYQGGERGTPP